MLVSESPPELSPDIQSGARGWRRTPYRVRQFLRGLGATVSPDEERLLTEWLAPDELALFRRMPVDARRHSLNVLYTLQRAGHDGPDLRRAALLHDVGKVRADEAGVRLQLWLRGPLVLAEAAVPDWLVRQAQDDPARGWRYALHVHFEHPALGAELARRAGSSELTCWLIAHHQDKVLPPAGERRTLLAALQWADERN